MTISRANIGEYVFWDEIQKRYDITAKTFIEQTDEDVRVVMLFVLRSWFIPQLAAEIKDWFSPGRNEVEAEKQLSLW